jgi:two-component sensor histidine kinase
MLKWLFMTYMICAAAVTATAQKQHGQPPAIASDSLAAQATRYLKEKRLEEGKGLFMQLINDSRSKGNKEQEAERWTQLSNSLPEDDTSATGKIASLQNALAVYEAVHNNNKQMALLEKIATLHIRRDNMDKAEQALKKLLHLQQSLGIKEIQVTCDFLTVIYRAKGNLSQALYYAIQAIKSAEVASDTTRTSRFYTRLALVYKDLNNLDQSLYWYRKAYEEHRRATIKDTFVLYTVTDNLITTLLLMDQPKEALNIVKEVIREYPPVKPDEKHEAAIMQAKCYESLKQYSLAEKYYLESVAWEESHPHGFTLRFQSYYHAGKFYSEQEKYEQSRHYLLQAAATPGFVNHATQRNVQLLLFKADSAAGNYIAAIDHYQRYKAINDTVYNMAKSRQIEELQVEYETTKKEQDIKILRKESQLQQTQLKEASLEKKVTIATILLLLIIISLLYNRYRIRQRGSHQLENQQKEINRKNESLQKLLNEKDGLLEEKEWLLKEIHHRVNNNLQIVMSLLSTQSAYLDNDSAILAIRDSQHRMRAMSLIHQKLYKSEKMTMVDMKVYIQELTEYLDDNFNVNNRIRFALDIAAIELDVAQAVPLGLILNEAITNAIKYAFPDNRQGTITISMEQEGDDHLLLAIADDGKGLPPGFSIAGSRSLGMSLIQGLTKQLNGSFVMKSDKGVAVIIRFPHERITADYPGSMEMAGIGIS